MTKTALEFAKQAREQDFTRSENKKDRKARHIDAAMGVAAKVFPKIGGAKLGGFIKDNDAIWYKQYIKDLDKFTNYPTYKKHGLPVKGTIGGSYLAGNYSSTYDSLPGIAIYETVSTIGSQTFVQQDSESLNPINQVLMRTKEQVLKSNSRSSVTWEAADLGLNLFATADIIVAMAQYKRLIDAASYYSADNAYAGYPLMRALGLNTDANCRQFISELPTHKQQYTLLATRFNNAVVAPKGITLFMRKQWLFSNIFADDADSKKPDLYAFVQKNVFILSDIGDKLSTATLDFNDLYETIGLMIQRLTENPDFQGMYADMRSAFSELIGIEENPSFGLVLNTSEINRNEIRNLETLPLLTTTDTQVLDYTQMYMDVVSDETGYLYQGALQGTDIYRGFGVLSSALNQSQSYINNLSQHFTADKMYNFHTPNYTGDDILDISQFKIVCSLRNYTPKGEATRVVVEPRISGTELIVRGIGYKLTADNGLTEISVSTHQFWDLSDGLAESALAFFNQTMSSAAITTAFDWAPAIHMVAQDALQVRDFVLADFNNTFFMDHESLERILYATNCSLIYIDSSAFKR